MFLSIFSDELFRETTEILPLLSGWGLTHVDFRSRVNGKAIENQTDEELRALKAQLDSLGLKCGAIQSSLCKVMLPSAERQAAELRKLEGIIRAADILDCRLVRSFHYWQNKDTDPLFNQLAVRPDELSKSLEMFAPVAKRAEETGLILGFENCGETPDEVIAFLGALGNPKWGLAWDVSNNFEILPEAQGDCVEYFKKCLKYANMIHVKARGVLPELEGRKVPWDRVLAGASAVGRDLPVSIETHNFSPEKLSYEDASKRCVDYIRSVWPAHAPGSLADALAAKEEFKRDYKPVRMVVVGLGMGKTRAKQISETSGLELAGVCDINLAKAKEIGEKYGVPYSDKLETFLCDPTVEVIYVVTPTGLHCEVAERALMAGKHVLLTKPMDATAEACRHCIALAEEKGLMLGIDFDLHFRGQLTELKEAADRGWFGRILAADITLNILRTPAYFKENGGWRGTWRYDGGGALSNQGIHEINRLITVLGVPDSISSYTARQTQDIEAEDYGCAVWRYADGKVVRIMATTSYPASSWYTRLELHGTEGAYLLTAGGPEGDKIFWWSKPDGGKWTDKAPFKTERRFRQGSDHFAYCLRTGEKPVVSARDGLISRIVLDTMYESSKRNGEWVKVEL